MEAILLMDVVCWTCLVICGTTTLMVILNFIFATKLDALNSSVDQTPFVSFLVPVRDEAHNLKFILPCLLSSTYRPLEVIILDDGSKDDSLKIARELLSKAPFPVRIVQGASWSESTLLSGKAHACAQLAELANGEIFIFCDADVRPSPNAIKLTVNNLMNRSGGKSLSGLSALPAQVCEGLLERLLIPWIMHLPLTLLLPLFCSWRLPFESMQFANGQWIALFRDNYFACGGHRSLGPTPLEDVALSRQMHRITGRGVKPVFAASDISVAMYKNWGSTLAGFSKNLVSIGGGRPFVFGCLIVLVNIIYMFPVWGIFVRPQLALVSLVLVLLSRILTARLFRMPLYDLLFHPLSLLLLNVASFKAVKSTLRGFYEWKGRVVKWSLIG